MQVKPPGVVHVVHLSAFSRVCCRCSTSDVVQVASSSLAVGVVVVVKTGLVIDLSLTENSQYQSICLTVLTLV